MMVGRIRKRINIESPVNAFNSHLLSVYEKPIENAIEALRKNKRKFPLYAFGNNIEAPDYLFIKNLNLNQRSVENKYPHDCMKKQYDQTNQRNIFDLPEYGNHIINHKRVYDYTTNTETDNFIESKEKPKIILQTEGTLSERSSSLNANRVPREFDILSNQNKSRIIEPPSKEKFFSRLASLNMFIKEVDSRKKMKKSLRRSDGIYDYLKSHKYVD